MTRINRRQATLGLLAAAAIPDWAQVEGPAFQKEVVEGYELIGKALAR